MQKLSDIEIKQVLEKIRNKYKNLIDEFNKPNSVSSAFEDRYISALKNRMDLSTFLIAEIEAVEQLYKIEVQKEKDKQLEIKMRKEKPKSFADKIYDENRKRIEKYPKIKISDEADEEIERLIGSIRLFIINYWPVIMAIYKNQYNSATKNLFGSYYHKLLTDYDYKGDVPIAKSYIFALQQVPKNSKKIDFEHSFILRESAFLINELCDLLRDTLKTTQIPDEKLNIKNTNLDKWIIENFNGLMFKDCLNKIINFVEEIIIDFRIKDIRKNKRY